MSIARATLRCMHAMTACLQVEKLMNARWAENRLADLNLWIAGIGALANSQLSLDTRLNSRAEVREVITNLLDLLSGTVEECQILAISKDSNAPLQAANEEDSSDLLTPQSDDIPPRSFSPWSDDSSSDEQSSVIIDSSPSTSSSLRRSMQDIEMMLDQLVQVAIAVRQSGKRSRLQRADQQFKIEEHVDLQTHLTAIILLGRKKNNTQATATEGMLDSSDLSEIQNRLVRCNLKRRNRFLYAQQHSKSLGSITAYQPRPPDVTTFNPPAPANTGLKDMDKRSKASKSNAVIQGTKIPTNPTILTGTKASAVSDSFVLPQPALLPAATSTIVSSTVINMKYPQPPKLTNGTHNFTCPCCCQTLPKAYTEGKRWKKHIAEDLSPYTCVLGGCSSPDVLYTTREDWRQHLLNKHQGFEYWICYSCEGTEQFRSEEAFIYHTTEKHGSSLDSSQISLLVDVCRRFAPMEIISCPLCNWPDEEEGEVDKTVLLDHIAKDLHTFSLRSLPWDDDNGQEDEQQVLQSSEKVFEWLVNNDLYKNPSLEKPPFEKKVYTSNYFRINSYFGARSASSVATENDSADSREIELKNIREMEGSDIFGSLTDEVLTRGDDEGDEWSPIANNPNNGLSEQKKATIPDTQDDPSILGSYVRKQKELEMMQQIYSQNSGSRQDTESEMSHLDELFGEDVLEMLLNQPGDEVLITNDIIRAIAGKEKNGNKIMTLLLNWKGDEILMSSKAVSTIVALFDQDIVELLLEFRREYQIIITQDIVKAAAGNEKYGKEVMALLLTSQGDHVVITEDALSAIDTEFDEQQIITLIRNPILISEDIVDAMARDGLISKEVAVLLESQEELDHRPMEEHRAPEFHSANRDFEIDTSASNYKSFGSDWCAIFNPEIQRDFDIDLVYCLPHWSVVHCVQISHDGKYLATGCDEYAQIFDIYTGEEICVLEDDSFKDMRHNYFRAISFSPDGRYLAAGSDDNLIRLWDIATRSIRNDFSGHNQEINSLDFSNNGRIIASGSIDCTVRLWDIEQGSNPWSFDVDDAVVSVAISPDNRLVAAGLLDNSVRVWDTTSGSCALVADLKGFDGHSDQVRSIAFLPNSKSLVSGSLDQTVKVWELDLPHRPIDSTTRGGRCIKTLQGLGSPVLSVTLTSDGSFVLSGTMDNRVYVWAAGSEVVQCMLKAPSGVGISVASSPQEGYFATTTGGKEARIWKYHRQINEDYTE